MAKTLISVIALATTCTTTSLHAPRAPETQSVLRPIATIALPNVAGRIDHLGFDAARERLFVAARGNNTVEVIDTSKNAHLRSLSGFHEPQGVAVLPDLGAVAVANGDTGTLQLIDASTLQTRSTTDIGGDADNVRYDSAGKRLFVAYQGGIAIVDPIGRVVQRIQINGHPMPFGASRASQRTAPRGPGPGWRPTAGSISPFRPGAGSRLKFGCLARFRM